MGVILDVVYNHVGPDGNYLKQFSESYFTDRYDNEWGEAINFDGPDSGPVRELVTANAAYWAVEYHLDGLRLDATQQIFDASPEHIIAAVARNMREAAAAQRRSVIVVAENEAQDAAAGAAARGRRLRRGRAYGTTISIIAPWPRLPAGGKLTTPISGAGRRNLSRRLSTVTCFRASGISGRRSGAARPPGDCGRRSS